MSDVRKGQIAETLETPEVRSEPKPEAPEIDLVDRVDLALALGDDAEEVVFLFFLPEIIGGLGWSLSAPGRSWLYEHARALLIWNILGFTTCGIGWIVLLPSLCQWRKKARQAAREGRGIERW